MVLRAQVTCHTPRISGLIVTGFVKPDGETCNGVDDSCTASAAMLLESTPPERNTPTGTSLRSCRRTESRNS